MFSPWMDVETGIRALDHPAIQTDSRPEMPRPVRPQSCPVEDWLAFLGHRWNALVLWHLRAAPLRHGELMECLPGITPKVLGERLAALQDRGLVARAEGRHGYMLTRRGSTLLSVLDQLELWARYAPPA
ncbi:helix-turn-helix domain-containing protein [Comamonas sp. w2-DMI]|uniref:winged helix-turn-helix transcriptional regulator n=1 Tax=Comamonas sp. w2-DMI TaxID=3126391 RepID=UPI0032E4E15F